MRPVYLFDDGKGLAPMTDLRAAFDVRTGAPDAGGRLAAAGELQVIGVFVPDALAAVTRERHTVSVNPVLGRRDAFHRGQCAMPDAGAGAPGAVDGTGIALVHEATSEIVAACMTPDLLAATPGDDTSAFRLEKSLGLGPSCGPSPARGTFGAGVMP
jgi:hypothetical protein